MFDPLPYKRAFEAIAVQLKEAIYSGKLKPGDKLPTERELAKMFKTSSAAVRSAVLSLEQAGLLRIKKGAGGGFFIQDLDFRPVRDSLNHLLRLGKASISDLTEARGALEPEAARLAAIRATAGDLKEMEKAILELKKGFIRALPRQSDDFKFHVCVAEGSKNAIIITFTRSLMDLLSQGIGSYTLRPEENETILDQHQRILDAIIAKDPAKAQRLSLEHVKTITALFKKSETQEHSKAKIRDSVFSDPRNP